MKTRRIKFLGKGCYTAGFEQTRLYTRVFGLADRVTGKPAPRAVLPPLKQHRAGETKKL